MPRNWPGAVNSGAARAHSDYHLGDDSPATLSSGAAAAVSIHPRLQFGGLAAACLLVFLAQSVVLVQSNAPTYDEGAHLAEGYSYLARRDFRLNPENPPLIKMLLAFPLFGLYRLPFDPPREHWDAAAEFAIGQVFLYRSALPADTILALGRLSNVVLGAVLIALVGRWAYRLWGRGASIVAMALACLEPTVVAHASLATTDVGTSLFVVLALYLFWEHAIAPSPWRVTRAGVAVGLALLSRYSGITLLLIVGVIVLAHVALGDVIAGGWPARCRTATVRGRGCQAFATVLLTVLATLPVIPAGYFFQGFVPWLSGLQVFLSQARLGQPAFLLGQHSTEGWWYYFPLAFLIKTSLGALALVVLSVALARAGAPLHRREMLFLAAPVLLFFVLLTQARVNIGVRHVLPVYPLLFVLASRVVTISTRPTWVMPSVVALALTFTALSALHAAPHQLAYFNELVGGPEQGYRYLGDSNVDWGQDLKRVKRFMDREHVPIVYLSYFGTAPPAYYGIRYQFVPGSWPLEWPPPADLVPANLQRKLLIVSVANLQEASSHSDPLFTWLQGRRPVSRIGYSIFVYDLSGDLHALHQLAEVYRRTGLLDRAKAEAEKILTLDPDHPGAKQLLEELGRIRAPASSSRPWSAATSARAAPSVPSPRARTSRQLGPDLPEPLRTSPASWPPHLGASFAECREHHRDPGQP
jgi:hypothetical protein